MDPNEQPPSMPDAPDKEKMEQVSWIDCPDDSCSNNVSADNRGRLTLYDLDPSTAPGEARVNKYSSCYPD